MFDISSNLVSEQNEISGNDWFGESFMEILVIDWWRQSYQFSTHEGLRFFGFCIVFWWDSRKHPIKTMHGNKDWDGKNLLNHRNLDWIDGESMEFEWNISQDTIRCSQVKKSKVHCIVWEKQWKFSQEYFCSCRCSTTFLVEQGTMNKNVWQTPKSHLCSRKDLEKANCHWLVWVPKRSGLQWKRIVHKEFGIISRKRCCWNSLKADIYFQWYDSIVMRSTQKQRTL